MKYKDLLVQKATKAHHGLLALFLIAVCSLVTVAAFNPSETKATAVVGDPDLTVNGVARLGNSQADLPPNRSFAYDIGNSDTANSAYGFNNIAAFGVLNSSTGSSPLGLTIGEYAANVNNYTNSFLSSMYGINAETWVNGAGSKTEHDAVIVTSGGVNNGIVQNYYGVRIMTPYKGLTGDITEKLVGLQIEDMTSRNNLPSPAPPGFSASGNFNIYSKGQNSSNLFQGKVRIGGFSSVGESVPTELHITPTAADIGGAFIDTIAGQTANALEVRNPNSTAMTVIAPNGNIGVGTNNPLSQIHISSPTAATLRIETTNNSGLASFQVIGPTGGLDNRWVDNTGPNTTLLNAPSTGVIRVNGVGLTFVNPSTNGYVRFATGGSTFANERMRIDPAGNIGIGTTTPAAKLDVNANSLIIEQSQTPTSAASPCITGMHAWDANYVYVCVATNTWKRSALSSW